MNFINFGSGEKGGGLFNIKLDKSFFEGFYNLPSYLKFLLCVTAIIGFFYFNFSNQLYQQEIKQIEMIQVSLKETTKLIYDMNLVNNNQKGINKLLLTHININREIIKEVIYTTNKRIDLIMAYLASNSRGYNYIQLKQEIQITNDYYNKIIENYIQQSSQIDSLNKLLN